jgi:uncharacterized MAPEG superfamily protein
MTTELTYLLLVALLTGSLWIPVVIGYVRTRGPLTPETYRVAPTDPLPDWVNRANRAHHNAVESFAPFAAVVLTAHVLGVHSALTVACAIVHVSGFGRFRTRTVLFTIAWLAFVVDAIALLRRAL